jgi:hypothetical protein
MVYSSVGYLYSSFEYLVVLVWKMWYIVVQGSGFRVSGFGYLRSVCAYTITITYHRVGLDGVRVVVLHTHTYWHPSYTLCLD